MIMLHVCPAESARSWYLLLLGLYVWNAQASPCSCCHVHEEKARSVRVIRILLVK